MKIRTNFVTNSSSYSSAEIKIDNPVLLEILERYRDRGAFETLYNEEKLAGIGASEREAKATYWTESELVGTDERKMAFCFYDEEYASVFFAPKTIEEVMTAILDVISCGNDLNFKNIDLVNECRDELEDRKDEIVSSYGEVYWEAHDDDNELDWDEESEWKFTFNGPAYIGAPLFKGTELFNVDHTETRADGAVRMLRFPNFVLNSFGDEDHTYPLTVGRMTTGCEIRFVGDAADVIVSAEDADGSVDVFRGSFFVRTERLTAGVPHRIELRRDTAIDKFGTDSFCGAYNPYMWRIVFNHDFTGLIHDVNPIKPVKPPKPCDLPKKRLLAYGSSITHGACAGSFSNSYIGTIGRVLGVDVLCKGMGGSCFIEEEVGDYIADSSWDAAILELGVNMIDHFEVSEFERRARYLIDCALEAGKPVVLISNFTHYNDLFAGPSREKNKQFVSCLEANYEEKKCPNLHYIRGKDIITELDWLSSDLLHPSPFGHAQMGRKIADILRNEFKII